MGVGMMEPKIRTGHWLRSPLLKQCGAFHRD